MMKREMKKMPMKNKGAAYFAEREGYSVRADADMETAELVLYGQVVRRRPFNGFTGTSRGIFHC